MLIITGCTRGYSTAEFVLLKSCRIKNTETDLDDKTIKRIEGLAYEVKSWKDSSDEELSEERHYPWDHVALSILQFPDKVVFIEDTCPICMAPALVKLYFRSPDATWQKLCGTAGDMSICVYCKKQITYSVKRYN